MNLHVNYSISTGIDRTRIFKARIYPTYRLLKPIGRYRMPLVKCLKLLIEAMDHLCFKSFNKFDYYMGGIYQ